jgi:ABC-type transporter Mla MlaB component
MNNYSITHRKAADQKTDQLVYSGEISFNHIQAIYKETESLLKACPQPEILVEDVDLLDLSFIQLLISLKKTYPIKVKLKLNEDLDELIRVSGFYKYIIEENEKDI